MIAKKLLGKAVPFLIINYNHNHLILVWNIKTICPQTKLVFT